MNMEELICILFALYLAFVWIFLAIQMNKWEKEDERKEDLYEKNNNHIN